MAEIPSQQTPTPPLSDSDPVQYWCYQCDKRVSVETLENLTDVVCDECKNGFVEVITASSIFPAALPSRSSDQAGEPSLNNQFLQVLRLIAQAARDDDAPPPPPSGNADPQDDDYLRIEFDDWENDDEDNDEDDDDGADEDGGRVEGEEENENDQDRSDRENENQEDLDEEQIRRRRRDLLRIRLGELATRAVSRRNRILDWADILMGLEDQSIEIRMQSPEVEFDGYVGNPEDYVDAAGYEALLQNLAESDSGGRRGAPPAAKSAILALPMVEIKSEEESFVCAICKDSVNVGDMVKKMPCEHGYHEECIVPWLGSRNSCPVCRFELETEDVEYEEHRKKKTMATARSGPSSSGS